MNVFVLAGVAAAQTAPPGTIVLRNDGHQNGDQVAFQQGFWNGECWASTYVPDPAAFPVTLHSVDVLVYGASPNGFYYFRVMDVDANNRPNNVIAETWISLQSSTTSINRIEMAISDWISGYPPFEFDGENFAVSMCIDDLDTPTGPSSYPQVARDTDGNDYPDRSWIYDVDGNWVRSQNYLVQGDWLMRANVETALAPSGDTGEEDSDVPGADGSDEEAGVLAVDQITPDSMVAGEPVDVVVLGSGFVEGVEVRIGGLPLGDLTVVNGETLDGRSPSALPVGIHDLEVEIAGGESVIVVGAFEVVAEPEEAEKSGLCGCSTGSRGAVWAWLGALAVWARRRKPA